MPCSSPLRFFSGKITNYMMHSESTALITPSSFDVVLEHFPVTGGSGRNTNNKGPRSVSQFLLQVACG